MSHLQSDKYRVAAQEDRSAPRTKLSIPAMFRASGSKGYQTVVRDLSLSGFSATAIGRLHPGTYCWITLPRLGSMPAQVVWWENGLVGCAFEQLLSPIVHDSLISQWSAEGVVRSV